MCVGVFKKHKFVLSNFFFFFNRYQGGVLCLRRMRGDEGQGVIPLQNVFTYHTVESIIYGELGLTFDIKR